MDGGRGLKARSASSRATDDYQLQMVDACSTVGDVQGTKRHTSKEWILFIESVQASEVARGRRIYVIYIDADSVARGFVLPEKLSEMGIELRVGAGNHHEWVGLIEVLSGDVVQRRAEMMLRRAGRGARWTLVAREHAWFLHNIGPQASGASPYQRHTGSAFDVSALDARGGVPVWGATVAYLLEEKARGPKGAEDGRSAEGTFTTHGFTSAMAYRIQSPAGKEVTRVACTPLNEAAIARAGIAPGMALVEQETQAVPRDMPAFQYMPQVSVVAPQKQKVEKTVRIVDVSKPQVGTRLQHYWRHKRGEGGDWYLIMVKVVFLHLVRMHVKP
jgi:hypothetical protein